MKTVSINTMAELVYPSQPSYSPNGRRIAYDLITLDKEGDTYHHRLTVLKDGESRGIASADDALLSVWLSADTMLLRMPSDTGSAFYTLNVDTESLAPLFGVSEEVVQALPMGEGRFALVCKYDLLPDRSPDYDEITEIPIWGNGRGMVAGYRSRLYLYDLKDQKMAPLTAADFQVQLCSYRDGILAWVGTAYDAAYNSRLGVYCLCAGESEAKCLLEPGIMYVMGMDILDDKVMLVGSDGERNDEWQPQGVYSLSVKDKALCKLWTGETVSADSVFCLDSALSEGPFCKSDGERLYFLSGTRFGMSIFSVDENGDLERPFPDLEKVDAIDAFSGHLCFRCLSRNSGPELYVDGQRITSYNDDFVKSYRLSLPVYQPFTNSEGIEIDGWVIKPTDYDESKTYPAIMTIHGGPRCLYNDAFFHGMQLFAAKEYFVFFCNPRGSDGRSRAFGDLYGKYGTVDYSDLMEFCDSILGKYPQIDPERLGVSGGSYGGFMVNWIIGHTNRFKAASSQRSISNWIMHQYTSEIGYHFCPSEMDADAATEPMKVWAQSPLCYVSQVVTPTLFMQSDRDYLCPVFEAFSMFAALRERKIDAKLCIFHGESHGMSRSGRISNRFRRLEELLAWFDHYLKN